MRAHSRVSVPFWPIRASSWNQISIGLPWAAAGSASFTRMAKFFKCLLRGLVSLRVARSHRQARELELPEKPADVTLPDLDVEPPLHHGLNMTAPPTTPAGH